MRIKDDSVETYGMRSELLFALVVANDLYAAKGEPLVVTSISDGRHSETSLHYTGCAADLRTWMFTDEEKHQLALDLKARLNQDYDVIVEATHLHVEYQPRRR